MDLRQLAYFVGIAQAGSFSKAAASLHIAQPALSRQIRLLEEESGVVLLRRHGRGAVPTAAGEVLLACAVSILQSVNEAKWALASYSRNPAGTIRVAVPPAISRLLTAELFQRLKAQFPRVSLQITEAWTGHIYEQLLDRKLDLGVICNSQLDDKMLYRPLVTESVYLIRSPGGIDPEKPLRIQDLAEIPLVLPPRPHGMRLLVEQAFRRFSVEPKIVLESEVWTVIKDVVQKGIACTLLPPREVDRELNLGLLQSVPIAKPGIRHVISLARLSSAALPPYADAIFEFMTEQLRSMILIETRRSGLSSSRRAHAGRVPAESIR
jgi:LysR family nitrogen assimilation transcriptional regulator